MDGNLFSDEYFMKIAIAEAEAAFDEDEVPVGAVIVCNDRIVAKGHNLTETLKDVTAHAEIIAITSAENNFNAKYLQDCTLYVTLEPCLMCAGAIAHAQIKRLVFGADDPKKGFSLYLEKFPYKTTVCKGVLAEKCSDLLKSFFVNKRK